MQESLQRESEENDVQSKLKENYTEQVCQACDESSNIPHIIQISRFRINNICCSLEEKLVHSSLKDLKGVVHISVSTIGKYAVIKHCAVDCCAPPSQIIELLNRHHLGATIQEVHSTTDDEIDGKLNYKRVILVLILWTLFIVGNIVSSDIVQSELPSMVIFIIGMFIGIIPILQVAYISILRFNINMNILMVIAIVGAISIGEYFDSNLVIVLYNTSMLLEDIIMYKVRKAISSTTNKLPKNIQLMNGKIIQFHELKIGDKIATRAGDMIMADGIITRGKGTVDESSLTGEAIPISKSINNKVFSGTILQNGYIEVEVDTAVENCTLFKLNQAVEEQQASRGEYAKFIDSFAFYWTPLVLLTALLLVVIGGGVTDLWHEYTMKAIVLLHWLQKMGSS
eukprot:gene10275-21441_t